MSEESKPKSGSRSRMDGATIAWIVVVVVVTVIASWFAFAAAYGVGVGSGNGSPPSGNPGGTSGGGPDFVYLSVNANPDRPAGSDQFEPANFTVPAHTQLVFTITNYDNGQNNVTAIYTKVVGTVHNLIYVNGSTTGVSQVTTPLAHTLTILQTGFNIPLPSAGPSSPSVVTFTAYFNETGTFAWHCMPLCDPWSMEQVGYMSGTITVV